MNKIIWWVVGVAVAIFVIIIAVNNGNRPTENIKIAALLSMSGDASAWGENAQKAIELATEEFNQKGGVNGRKIEMIYEDTGGDPKRAVAAFQKVTTIDRVIAVLGPLNQTEDAAVVPLIDQDNIPMIIPGYLPPQNRKDLTNPLIVWMDAELEAGRLAEYVFNQGIHTVGIIGTLDAWESTVSNAFAERFKAVGGTITDTEIVQPDSSDMRLSATKVIASKPQAIFLGTYYQFVNSAKALSDQKYSGKLFGIEVDDYLAGETEKWSSGLIFIAPDYYTNDFTRAFTSKYGRAPGLPAGQSYDAANLLFSLLEKSIDRDDILKSMNEFSSYDGVSGQLMILSDGRPSLPTALFELKEGKVVRIGELK